MRRPASVPTCLSHRPSPRWFVRAVLVCAHIGFGGHAASVGGLIGNFDLATGSFANTLSGSTALAALAPVSTSGTYGFVTSGTNPGWFWSGAVSPGTGVTLTGLPANDGGTFGNYSIGMRFAISQVAGYRRLIMFKDAEPGQYVHDGRFRFYDGGFNNFTGGTITPDTFVDFVITRDAANGAVNAYLNGSATPLFSFFDGVDARTNSARTLQFFRDNGTSTPEFSAAGGLSLLRVWDSPLSAEQIPTAMTAAVPEPSGVLFGAAGVAIALSRLLLRRHSRDA